MTVDNEDQSKVHGVVPSPRHGKCQPELVVDLRNYGEGQRYGEILQDSAIGDHPTHYKLCYLLPYLVWSIIRLHCI
jgi:hypothetical protein